MPGEELHGYDRRHWARRKEDEERAAVAARVAVLERVTSAAATQLDETGIATMSTRDRSLFPLMVADKRHELRTREDWGRRLRWGLAAITVASSLLGPIVRDGLTWLFHSVHP